MNTHNKHLNSSILGEYKGVVVKYRPNGMDSNLFANVEEVTDIFIKLRQKNGIATVMKVSALAMITPVFHQPARVI